MANLLDIKTVVNGYLDIEGICEALNVRKPDYIKSIVYSKYDEAIWVPEGIALGINGVTNDLYFCELIQYNRYINKYGIGRDRILTDREWGRKYKKCKLERGGDAVKIYCTMNKILPPILDIDNSTETSVDRYVTWDIHNEYKIRCRVGYPTLIYDHTLIGPDGKEKEIRAHAAVDLLYLYRRYTSIERSLL